ncbi:hypothetical protein A0H81_14501 [Grifola frondosa]|uniref:RZ-type domain-containing protein n=1 Tax=Grifola frondosa TaxID=5627 RepID=A0A1C7LLH8_GRIFR|nr:hypothetical protein A0H81_14501 [Grifola frondosa]
MIKDYLAIHRRIYRIATTRGAHVKAYEAALATLFRLEMDSIANDPTRASEAPEPVAMRIVDQKIGQPPHKADTRFQIEAYFLLLELRSMLAQVAFSRLQGLSTSVNQSASDADLDVTPVLRQRHRDLWQSFVDFLYDSCIADAKKAFTIAEKSSASRQTARSAIYILRFQFEQFRFQVLFERENLLKARLLTEDRRNRLARQINARKLEMLTLLFQIQRDYIRCRPSRNTEDLKNERKWVDENCRQKVEHWRSECDELEKYVLTDGIFYEPLSLQEKSDIVKAFNFSHRGHFYNCENGHTFVIGECGGAMQASRCPECHAPVGGNQHTLISSNARAAEYEAIAATAFLKGYIAKILTVCHVRNNML